MKIASCILLYIIFFGLSAAVNPITGTVRDVETGEKLPFANVVVEGQNTGTISNADGDFVLDVEGLEKDQLIVFTFMGYETLKIPLNKLQEMKAVELKPAIINLNELAVYSRQLTAKDILDRVKENYEKNHPRVDSKQRIFYHKYEKTLWPRENELVLKSSNFVGLDRATVEDLFSKIPEEFVEYHDAMVDLYSLDGEKKLKVVEAVSLEEGSMQDLQKEVEQKLKGFFEDFENTQGDPDIYYKFRTGIFAQKIDDDELEPDSIQIEQKKDSLNYLVSTNHLRSSIQRVIRNWADIGSKNWEFIDKTSRYDYSLGDVTIFNDELVYPITFTPQRKGLFEGVIYISTSTFGILQLDYAFAEGKSDENIQILGFGHSTEFKRARVIYERTELGYFVKYINAEQKERAAINRDFSVMKKEKRFLWDKELNELRMSIDLDFNMSLNLELLILDQEPVDTVEFKQLTQEKITRFRKEYVWTPEMWNNRTVIAPSAELREYTRKK
ncbi:MAG: carboxypeptidase-like regulatory domain-containing protein [Bacteroidota bacterium]